MTISHSTSFGVDSSTAPLRRVLMRRPLALLTADPQRWHYAQPPDAPAITAEFDRFVDLVADSGAEIDFLPDIADGLADSVFTYDPSFTLPDGVVVLRPGKSLRVDEAALHRAWFESAGIDVLGEIEAPGTVEGGDMFWLDSTTIAIGRGFRTNQAGIDQFSTIVAAHGIDVVVYDLPYFHGPEACLHLLSVISPLADDLALVHAPLLPTQLYVDLVDRGVELLVAPPDEFAASNGLNLNVLATAPRQCIAVAGFDGTLALMRSAGCDVRTFDGDHLCVPNEGGPTCLTRPLARA